MDLLIRDVLESDLQAVTDSSHNTGSVRFHQRHGFVECGRFLQVGIKSGQPFDMIWMHRIKTGVAVG